MCAVCVCVCVFLPYLSVAPYYIIIRGLSVSTIFLRSISRFIHYKIFGTIFLNIECGFRHFLQALTERFLTERRIRRDIVINVRMSSSKVPAVLVRFQSISNFLKMFSKHPQILDFFFFVTKITSGGSRVIACGPTDMTKLTCFFFFLQFCGRP